MEQQINVTQLVYFVALAVLFLGVLWNSRKSNGDIVAALDTAIDRIVNNPVYLQNAKGATESVPQDVFIAVYKRFDAIQAFLGDETQLARLLQKIEDAAKLIDKDPANDPAKTGEVQNG